MDGSFITKSGKRTEGIDWDWNGCASCAEKGLEMSLVGDVDIATETAHALSAQQALAQTEIPSYLIRMDQYLYHLEAVRPHLPAQGRYLAVDRAYAKAAFVQRVGEAHLDGISSAERWGVQPASPRSIY